MKIYISGKISGISEKEYTENFYFADLELSKQYSGLYKISSVINPLDIKPFLGIKSWTCYMINDLRALRKCTHIALMYNWKDSKGACIEHFVGKFILKLKVIYL